MKKPFLRAAPDRTQSIRLWFQLAFLALNVWIGIQFNLFVRYYETGGRWALRRGRRASRVGSPLRR